MTAPDPVHIIAVAINNRPEPGGRGGDTGFYPEARRVLAALEAAGFRLIAPGRYDQKSVELGVRAGIKSTFSILGNFDGKAT